MHWDNHTIFSVISGVTLMITGLLPGLRPGDRAWSILGGVAFVAYGFYVATQNSGTFVFPGYIYVLPFALAAYLVATLWYPLRPSSAPSSPPPPDSPPSSEVATTRGSRRPARGVIIVVAVVAVVGLGVAGYAYLHRPSAGCPLSAGQVSSIIGVNGLHADHGGGPDGSQPGLSGVECTYALSGSENEAHPVVTIAVLHGTVDGKPLHGATDATSSGGSCTRQFIPGVGEGQVCTSAGHVDARVGGLGQECDVDLGSVDGGTPSFVPDVRLLVQNVVARHPECG